MTTYLFKPAFVAFHYRGLSRYMHGVPSCPHVAHGSSLMVNPSPNIQPMQYPHIGIFSQSLHNIIGLQKTARSTCTYLAGAFPWVCMYKYARLAYMCYGIKVAMVAPTVKAEVII